MPDTLDTFDTSGTVRFESDVGFTWPDIAALPYGLFAQGYIEAAFASGLGHPRNPSEVALASKASFSDLAPPTLEAMLKDCGEIRKRHVIVGGGHAGHRAHGCGAWGNRQRGETPGFPPIRLHLADDGLIYQTGNVHE